MRPYIFFIALATSWVAGYWWWRILGDSWLLTSTTGALFGWIGCIFANHLTAPPILLKYPAEAIAFAREQDANRRKAYADYVTATHPARFDKVQQKGR